MYSLTATLSLKSFHKTVLLFPVSRVIIGQKPSSWMNPEPRFPFSFQVKTLANQIFTFHVSIKGTTVLRCRNKEGSSLQ